ncbi:MAG: MOSC domain-containing protein [Acidimicrobiaceae bacterium]|nr:MOSC domain-containing protein [Acidimicrobiaceae bacterium]
MSSLNVAAPRRIPVYEELTGIDKRPVDGPVSVRAPGSPKGGSGLVGDAVCDELHHGGDSQAVYAYAREDLDWWEKELGASFSSGSFGENLTTSGIDITAALIGERWRVGDELVLQVTDPRIPCRTFALWLQRNGWVETFTAHGAPGTYFAVIEPGEVRRGDPITVLSKPEHDVSIGVAFRAKTTEPELFGRVLTAGEHLSPQLRETAIRRARNRTA